MSSQPVNVQDYADIAKQKIAKNAYDYYASGSNDMITLSENKTGKPKHFEEEKRL
jgi:(S)-2-hydroxy-acid oxidase